VPAHLPTAPARLAAALSAAVFPARCFCCGAFFQKPAAVENKRILESPSSTETAGNIFSAVMAAVACPACRTFFVPVTSPICLRCGTMFPSREGADHLCEACLREPRPYGMARCAGIYDAALMKALHRLKYDQQVALARPLARLLWTVYQRCWHDCPVDVVVPVPLHAKRLRKRGFNQAALIVDQWRRPSSRIGGRQMPPVAADMLSRIRPTAPQTGLGREARFRNMKNAFVLTGRASPADRHILLIDDVFTTGATVEACARVLLRGGARRVDVLTLARALDNRLARPRQCS